MRKTMTVLAACVALGAWGQAASPQKPHNETIDFDGAMKRLEAIRPESEPPKPKLGPIDQWRYESCQSAAAKAPTSQGVFAGIRVCREKFGQ